jgi:hypothetical protein
VLGEPGAGKSTLLLELAFDLVQQAERDYSLLLPVIVPLSSWASQRQPLEQWLAGQIALLYDIALPLSERWVRQERLLPLLDGLDEMEEEARVACIVAINVYHREHLHPLVVAGRKAEYEAAATQARLVLHSAVVVQPLTSEQVDAYLVQSGEAVAALRTVLRENPVLQELATTPLLLSIMLLTYQGKAVSDLPTTDSLPDEPRQLFAHYVERMVERKGTLARSSPQEIISWLRWLAGEMRGHDQAVFYLEHLQPDWLTSVQQYRYSWLAVRLPALLIGILASLTIVPLLKGVFFGSTDHLSLSSLFQYAALGGLLGWLFSRTNGRRGELPEPPEGHHHQERLHRFSRGIPPGIIIGLLGGLSFGLDLGGGYGPGEWLFDGLTYGVVIGLGSLVLSWLFPAHPPGPATASIRTPRRWLFLVHLSQTIHGRRAWLVIAILGAGYGLSWGLSYGLVGGLCYGLRYGLIFGIISVLVSLTLEAQAEGIALTERLRWTWRSLKRSLLTPTHVRNTLLVGSGIGCFGFIFGLGWQLSVGLGWNLSVGLSNGLSLGLSYGLSCGLLYWILLGLFQGVSNERIEDNARRLPNQGVRRSLHNSVLLALISNGIIVLFGGLSSGLSIGLIEGLDQGLSYGLNEGLRFGFGVGLNEGLDFGLSYGLILAVCGGLLVCASRGGLAVLRHYVIRLLLARSHTFPWHAPRFLEEATARILLRRVGGGYSFPHRLLLDYFANLPHQKP